MPSNIVDDPTSFPTVTTPVDADVPNAASIATSLQELANRTAYLNQNYSPSRIAQSFESTMFPPVDQPGIWSAPSARFGSDLAFVRDTSNPLVGAAAANRPGSQTASSEASIGFEVYIQEPSRIQFFYALLCNAAFADSFEFFIDGTQTKFISCSSNTQVSAGRFVSDVLTEGHHTFDWRFNRGSASSVAGEKAILDYVTVVPEHVWGVDRARRIELVDDFYTQGLVTGGPWVSSNSGNAGTTAVGSAIGGGSIVVTSAATSIGDWEALALNTVDASAYVNGMPFMEVEIMLPSLTNIFFEVGFMTPGANYFASLCYNIAGSTGKFAFKTQSGGSATLSTAAASGPAIGAGTTLRIAVWGVGGILNDLSTAAWNASINGKDIYSDADLGSVLTAPHPLGSFVPYVKIGSITASGARVLNLDYIKFQAMRLLAPSTAAVLPGI